MGLIEETSDQIEGKLFPGEARTIPVFSSHILSEDVDKKQADLVEYLRIHGEYPNIHFWPESTNKEIKQLLPDKVAVDGNYYYPDYSSLDRRVDIAFWLGLPGNPFEWRKKEDLFIVLGDLPFPALIEYKLKPDNFYYKHLGTNGFKDRAEFTNDFYARQLVVGTTLQIWERATRTPIELYETRKLTKEEDEFLNEQQREINSSKLVATLGALGAALQGAGGTRRRMMLGLGLAGLGTANAVRVGLPLLTDKVPLTPVSHPLKKLGADVSGIARHQIVSDVREAMVDIKLRETPGNKGVAVFGTGHKDGSYLWNKPKEEEEFLEKFFVDLLRQAKDVAKTYDLNLDESNMKARVVNELATLFGGTAVLRVKEAPKRLTPKEVTEQITFEKRYVSPVVTRIAQNAGKKAGFIS